MGGLLAVRLAAGVPLSGVVTINSPIYYWNIPRILTNLKTDFHTYRHKYWQVSTDKSPRSLLEFVTLLRGTKPLLSQVTCPLLVLQTQDDDTTNPKSASYLARHSAGPATVRLIVSGGHECLGRKEVADLTVGFLTGELNNQSGGKLV